MPRSHASRPANTSAGITTRLAGKRPARSARRRRLQPALHAAKLSGSQVRAPTLQAKHAAPAASPHASAPLTPRRSVSKTRRRRSRSPTHARAALLAPAPKLIVQARARCAAAAQTLRPASTCICRSHEAQAPTTQCASARFFSTSASKLRTQRP